MDIIRYGDVTTSNGPATNSMVKNIVKVFETPSTLLILYLLPPVPVVPKKYASTA